MKIVLTEVHFSFSINIKFNLVIHVKEILIQLFFFHLNEIKNKIIKFLERFPLKLLLDNYQNKYKTFRYIRRIRTLQYFVLSGA